MSHKCGPHCSGECKDTAHEAIDKGKGFVLVVIEKEDREQMTLHTISHSISTHSLLSAIIAISKMIRNNIPPESLSAIESLIRCASTPEGVTEERAVNAAMSALGMKRDNFSDQEIEDRLRQVFGDNIEIIKMDGPFGFSMMPGMIDPNSKN